MNAGAIVLCGGKSTRMGTSKAMLPFGPETMLQRVVRLLETVVSPIVVVAAADQQLPDLPPNVIVTRDEREARGPLEGLRAGLKALPADVEAAYVTSCDVPLLVPGFVRQMLDLADGYDVAVIENEGFAHPLSAVYRRATLPHVEDLLAQDRLRPAFLFEAVNTGPGAVDRRSRVAHPAQRQYAGRLRTGARRRRELAVIRFSRSDFRY
jgi:molybdopterin-guanine dinucleotide biosynthesis protein A